MFQAVLNEIALKQKAIRVDQYDLSTANNLFYVGANIVVVGLLAGYFLQLFLENFFPHYLSPERPSVWVFVTVATMYGMLISSWFMTLFADIRLTVHVHGTSILLTSAPPGDPNAITGSTLDFVGLLPPTASTFLVLGQMVLPQVALVLFLIGEVLRQSENRDSSRRCTVTATVFCKMCCSVMFAEILGLHLFLQMQVGNTTTDGAWDFGFTCFSIFCMGSAILACFIKPARPVGEEKPLNRNSSSFLSSFSGRPKASLPWMLEKLGKQGTFYVAFCLTVLFIILICVGVVCPFIGANLTENILIKPHGPFPDYLLPFLNSDVNWNRAWDSIATAIVASTMYLFDGGQANGILAFLALSFFAVLCPFVDMLVISISAYKMSRESHIRSQEENDQGRVGIDVGGEGAMVARVLKQCDMLDACIMGIFLLIFATFYSGAEGFQVYFEWSIILLICAEVTHYFTHFTVVPAIEFVQSHPCEAPE